MEACLFYLLKMLCCSAVLYGYYRLALYNERFHQWNRFYLLASMLLSVIIPFVNIPLANTGHQNISTAISLLPWNAVQAKMDNPHITWQQLALASSLAISAILLGKLAIGIFRINRLYKSNKVIGLQNNISLILTSIKDAPFSFLNWLFWRQDIDPESDNGKRILNHELTHISEGHSIDKLSASVLVCLFWMNPFFWLMRKELNMLHEFLADRKAIGENDGAAFANMILQSITVTPCVNTNLVNPFFSSTIKRRLLMITTSKLAKYSYLRRISGLVLMIISTVVLALSIQQAQAQTKKPVKPADPAPATKPAPATQEKPGSKPFPPPKITVTRVTPPKTAGDTTELNENQNTGVNTTAPVRLRLKATTTGQNKMGMAGNPENQPLFTVDGKVVDPEVVNAIDPNNIQSISVLKGESATAKYGSDAKYGAVEITMKNEVVVQGFKLDKPKAESGEATSKKTDEIVVMGYGTKKITIKDAKPLIYINGVQATHEEMNNLKPNSIESINVLKDKSATDVYGEKGKDGVILIVTKKPIT